MEDQYEKELVDVLKVESTSEFRQWCGLLWEEHRVEVYNWTGKNVDYTSSQFFAKNKWYLKSLYVSRGDKRWNF